MEQHESQSNQPNRDQGTEKKPIQGTQTGQHKQQQSQEVHKGDQDKEATRIVSVSKRSNCWAPRGRRSLAPRFSRWGHQLKKETDMKWNL